MEVINVYTLDHLPASISSSSIETISIYKNDDGYTATCCIGDCKIFYIGQYKTESEMKNAVHNIIHYLEDETNASFFYIGFSGGEWKGTYLNLKKVNAVCIVKTDRQYEIIATVGNTDYVCMESTDENLAIEQYWDMKEFVWDTP